MSMISTDIVTYAALTAAPTLATGHDADLKFETRWYRIWLPRVTDADIEGYGLPFCPIQIEVYRDSGRRWVLGDTVDLPNVLHAARGAGLDV